MIELIAVITTIVILLLLFGSKSKNAVSIIFRLLKGLLISAVFSLILIFVGVPIQIVTPIGLIIFVITAIKGKID